MLFKPLPHPVFVAAELLMLHLRLELNIALVIRADALVKHQRPP
ncbi:MAG: hypothetical protein NUV42_03070 [Candidatus Yonathbacteria bacterium]|nr:hypothetical protein [Candidatus Yonathbacteria bacterium]